MKILLHSTVILALLFTVPVSAQTSIIDTGSDTILSFETMHVHFDKDIYLPGETIWFKAYLYNVNEISLAATNFYAAIYDEKGKLIRQKQYPILSGSANGDFEVPDSLPGSRIRFRAFTKAMIQYDSNNIHERVLEVYKKENTTVPGLAKEEKLLQFFPEGGQIIALLQNYIGVAATDANGNPAKIKGKIVETGQKKIYSDFSTNSMGLGQFIFAPAPNKNYSAIWADEKGITQEALLPVIKNEGVSFHAEQVDKELQYVIARNKTNDSLSELHLLAQMGNYKVYQADLVIVNEMDYSTAGFSIDSIPPGLLQLTLFDKYWNKLQERNLFINVKEIYSVPLVNTTAVKFGAKEKSMIEITLQDTSFSSLSVSVADVSFYKTPAGNSIAQDLLLNIQLEKPAQNVEPFLKTGNSEMLNLVTLNYNCKKYSWQKLVNKSNAEEKRLDDYISLSVMNNQKIVELPKDDAVNLILYSSIAGKQFYSLKAAEAGTFKKSGLIFFDSVKVAYQLDKNKKLTGYLKVFKEDSLKMPGSINALQNHSAIARLNVAAQNNTLQPFVSTKHSNFNDVQTIKEVTVKARYTVNPKRARIDELDRRYTSGMFSGTVKGFQLNVIDDTLGVNTTTSLKNYMRYRIPGLGQQNGTFGKLQYQSNESNTAVVQVFVPTLVFLNEVQIHYDIMGEFEMVNMTDVAYVKYIPGIVIGGGFVSTSGAIYIYTKKGNETGSLSKGLPYVYIKGYSTLKEFEQPDVNELKAPDVRSTLYWNPNIVMDKTNNKMKIEYFNNDVSKKLLLRIEGVNTAGKLICVEKVIE